MNQLLMSLGGLTLGGSAVILVLALAGRSTRARYGARWRCWAWALLCLRLALPFPLVPQVRESAPIQVDVPRSSLLVQSPRPSGGFADAPSSGEELGDPSAQGPSGGGSAPVQGGSAASAASEGGTLSLPRVLVLLWLAGAAAVLAWSLAAHLRFLRWLRRWSAPVRDGDVVQTFNQLGDCLRLARRPGLLACPGLKVPMLAGVLRPVLLLPEGTPSGRSLELALLHELTHFRRREIWLKALGLWVRALYWFNPLVWLMGRLIERDTELACDEEALGRLAPQDRGAYGQTILAAAGKK